MTLGRRLLRTTSAAALAGAATVALAVPAAAAAPIPTSAARLQGSFQLAGRVTTAVNVRGEHRRDVVQRVWSFLSACPAGPCTHVTLVRKRATGSDKVVLTRRAPGSYDGHGSFTTPLRCAGRTYAAGERVPFTITVRITAASSGPSGIVAARITATYVNRSRVNLTPCVAFLGHDSARYHGYLIPAG